MKTFKVFFFLKNFELSLGLFFNKRHISSNSSQYFCHCPRGYSTMFRFLQSQCWLGSISHKIPWQTWKYYSRHIQKNTITIRLVYDLKISEDATPLDKAREFKSIRTGRELVWTWDYFILIIIVFNWTCWTWSWAPQ